MYGLTGWHTMVVLSILVVPLTLWIIALVQIARSGGASGPVVGWVALITLVAVIGPILWFVIGRRSLGVDGRPTLPG